MDVLSHLTTLVAEYNPENSLFLIAILKLQQKLLNKV